MRIVYVLLDHPIPSERFVAREICALRGLGDVVQLFCLRPPAGTRGEHGGGGSDGWRPAPAWSLRFWHSALRAALRRPRAGLRLLALAFAAEPRDPGRALHLALVALAAGEALRGDIPDLLHAHFGSAPATVALLLSYWLRCPFGFSVHARDLYAERNALAGKARRASHVISCSEVAAEDLRSRLPAELRSRVELHHHGLDLELWQPRHGANERTDEALILAVGRFEAKKGFAHLVDACAVLARDGFRFRCELIGAGREERRLARRIRRRGLEDRVHIVAWCSPPRLREHYATASVLAVPSVIDADGDRDGIPNVLIEALACGVPVVASSIASLERLLGPARAARLTPPGDGDALAHALRQVCTDAVLARSLAENGRRLVEARFDLRRNARELRARLARSAVSPIQPGAVPEEPRPRPTAHRWRIISSAVEGSSRRGPDRLPS